ncbi:DUF192 domain-containing protein [Candidatus Microgenomates bacterium]|nr:MAG: DUF192 domain-containing protein [Candidatus Microgenomates bacterium]
MKGIYLDTWYYLFMQRKGLIILFGIISVLSIVILYHVNKRELTSDVTSPTVTIGSVTYSVEIADTDAARSQGLSDRENLAQNAGMLFHFPQKSQHGFWMNRMHFPIDIIWISDNKIVDVSENAPIPAETGGVPQTFSPKEPVNYVLEVNAGEFARNHFSIGQEVEINMY